MLSFILHESMVQADSILSIVLGVLFFSFIFILWLYIRKFKLYSKTDIVWFIVYFGLLIMALKEIMNDSSFTIPHSIIIIVEGIFLFLIFLVFLYMRYSYNCIITKEFKTELDIKKRQKLVFRLSILFGILFNSIPFILDSWGINILPSLNHSLYNSQIDTYVNFINSGIRVSFVVTIAVFFADNIFNRISSDIYTYDDTRGLKKFCLYLRPFSVDNNYEEKMICNTLQQLYPVYAIGDPNKVLQPNAAERIYVTDELWQDAVNDLSKRSCLILLRLGKTDGTLWEILNIINSNQIHKVLFIAYTQDDYDYFADVLCKKCDLEMPLLNISNKYPIAFYFIEECDSITLKQYRIKSMQDMDSMINEYLDSSSKLFQIYSTDLEYRNAVFKYMFNKENIPLIIRKSLNWGIISPIVNMRHWPFSVWGIFIMSLFFTAIFHNYIPAFLFFIFAFIFGNRIEWLSKGWSCEELFLRHQRKEAIILWLSVAFGVLYSFIYIFVNMLLA